MPFVGILKENLKTIADYICLAFIMSRLDRHVRAGFRDQSKAAGPLTDRLDDKLHYLLEFFLQGRDDLEEVIYHTVIGLLEDRCVRVLIDSHDHL